MSDIVIVKRVIDYVGLNVRDVPDHWLNLFKDMPPVLALMQGMGSDGAKLVNVDANGNLQVTTAGQAASGGVTVFDDPAFSTLKARVVGGVSTGATGALAIVPYLDGKGGQLQEWASASATSLTTSPTPPAALVAPPGNWSVSSNAGLGVASSASKAAGAAGVRHILTGYTLTISSQAAPAAGTVTINIRDGASGAGTVLEAITVQIPAALYAPVVIARSGLSLPGSAATAMTVEQSAAYAAVAASISFEGYDAS